MAADNMSIVNSSNSLAELVAQLGNIDLARIRVAPAPGTGTVADVEFIHAHENRLFELVDGILVEKVMGFRESLLAAAIVRILGSFVAEHNLGLVLGADGMLRLFPDTVRIPDVAFIGWDHLPDRQVPKEPVPSIAPTLAVEVLSESNTSAEMLRKRTDYFSSGVQIVWEVDIRQRTVTAYEEVHANQVYAEQQVLTAASILPNFELRLDSLFAELDRRSN